MSKTYVYVCYYHAYDECEIDVVFTKERSAQAYCREGRSRYYMHYERRELFTGFRKKRKAKKRK